MDHTNRAMTTTRPGSPTASLNPADSGAMARAEVPMDAMMARTEPRGRRARGR